MPDVSKLPIVHDALCDVVQHASLNVGYLGKRDGALWCFPDDETTSTTK